MNSKITFFGLCIGSAIVLFLCICWLSAYGAPNAIWSQTFCYSGLTWYALSKASSRKMSLGFTSLALVIGRLLPVLLVYVTDFRGSLGNLIIDLSCIASILLTTVCFHEKRPYAFVLSAIIIILLNTFVFSEYEEWIRQMTIGQ